MLSYKGTTCSCPRTHPTAQRINVSLCRWQRKEIDSIREAFDGSGLQQGIEERGREEVAKSRPYIEHTDLMLSFLK